MSGNGVAPVCLSIQSHVVAGAVGHGASLPVLTAMGVDVWPIPTVVLSGHAATPGVRGRALGGAEIAALGEGLTAAGALAQIDAVLTGYLGSAEAAEAVAALVAKVRAARPAVKVVVDPVLGDHGRLYLPAEMIAVYRDQILPLADVVTPNQSELAWLTGQEPWQGSHEDRAIEAAAQVLSGGPNAVIATSYGAGAVTGALIATPRETAIAEAPAVPGAFHGAGDVLAAHVTAGLMSGVDAVSATAAAVGAAAVLARTAAATGVAMFPVVAARDAWLRAPPAAVRRLGAPG